MKTILTIGHKHFLIPANANLNTIIAVLSKATQLDRDWTSEGGEIFRTDKRPDEIKVQLVKDSQVFLNQPKLKAIPENASPDAHNTFGS
ncbi:MAG: hypothetical protein ACTHMT_05755 [Verrucomicrobiota bacterium]